MLLASCDARISGGEDMRGSLCVLGTILATFVGFDAARADVTISGTIRGDNCSPLTDPDVPGTCPIVTGSGFSVLAYLATDAGADCCGLDGCGRCLIRYAIVFDAPFEGAPTTNASAGDATTTCTTYDVTVSGFTIRCDSPFGSFVPPHDLFFDAAGELAVPSPTPTETAAPTPTTVDTCPLDLLECNAELAAAQSALAAATADADQDGRRDLDDTCPATSAAAAVDQTGCSLAQFCAQFDVTVAGGKKACRKADWRNDEPTMRARDRDCTVDAALRQCIPAS